MSSELNPLPFGKQYHVFIYHYECREDTEFATKLAEKLTGRGFRCCCSSVHFNPGRTAIGNIVSSIDLSMKMIIVYSKSFFLSLESTFTCEMQIQHCLNTAQSLLIPVKYDECSVPWLYESLPCIDARSSGADDKWLTELIRSITNVNAVTKFFLAGPGISLILKHVCQFKLINIESMKVLASRRGVYSSRKYKRLKLNYTMMKQLQNNGVILVERKFETMMSDIDYMFRDYCRTHKLFFPVFAYLFILGLSGIAMLATIRYFKQNLLARWLPIFLVFFFGLCFSVVMSCLIKYKWKDIYHKSYKDYLKTINYKLFEDNILVTIVEEMIYIVYIDYEPCKRYLEANRTLYQIAGTPVQRFRKRYKQWRNWLYGEIPPDKSLEERVLIKEAGMYACWYLRGKLENPKEKRHEAKNGPCLCQYIEDKYQLKPSDTDDCLQIISTGKVNS